MRLLVPHSPEPVIAATLPLVTSPSDSLRITAARHLASLGREETLPALRKLLDDTDGYVRSAVQNGTKRALAAGECSGEFRREMYDALLKQCDQDWGVSGNKAPYAVIALDPARAAIDFASLRWLSPDNRNAWQILKACNEARISLPEDLVRRLLEHSLPLAVGKRCSPHQYVVAAALEALAWTIGDRARPLLECALASEQDRIQVSAAKGLATLVGMADPIKFILERVKEVGFQCLTPPQRVIYCGFEFDSEVCNGGLLQFFGNSSGNHAVETLEALRVLNHAEACHALETAMSLVGPLSREPEQDMRMAAFEGRFDELRERFYPLECAYYATDGLLRQKLWLHAIANPQHFPAKPTPESG